jgi:hypothetical protein
MDQKKPEVWLRGPVPGIPPLLQPVAHTLLQAREEVNVIMESFPEILLWSRVAGLASPGFHLQHMTGVLDRLLTYAAGGLLSKLQMGYLIGEGRASLDDFTVHQLVDAFNKQVDVALVQIAETDETMLTAVRGVGRQQVPSTVIGLYTHAAEHVMRHTGQLLVTVRVLKSDFAD